MNKGSWDIDFNNNTEIKQDHLDKVYACRRRVFTTEEDKILADLVSSQSCTNWFEIAQKIEGKTARQCRDRWMNYLSPSNSFAPWTIDEDRLIVEKVNEIGTKWSTIAKYVEGRSDNTIKNRWYSGLKKNCLININGKYVLKCDKQAATPAPPPTTNAAQRSQGKFTARAKASPQSKKTNSASFFQEAPLSQPQQTTQISSMPTALLTSKVPMISAPPKQKIPESQQSSTLPEQQPPTHASSMQETLNPNLTVFQHSSITEAEQSPIHLIDQDSTEQYQLVLPNMPLLFNQATLGFQPLINPHLQSSCQNLPLLFPHIPLVLDEQHQFMMKSELEMETLENDFWDRQLINQVAEMSQDPFQIPELYGEWF